MFFNWPLFSICRTSIMSVMGPYACCVSRMCCEYFEFRYFHCICSLYLVLKLLPICPMYFCWHVLHYILYMPLLLYLLVLCFFLG
jgi:hypothetical protein